MTLKAVVANLDAVPEAMRAEYSKGTDDRFYLNVDGVDEMPAVVGLKRKNAELLDEKKGVQAKLDAIGATAEEIAELREKAKDAGKGANAEKVAELEKKLAEVSKNAQLEVQKAKDDTEAAKASFHNAFLDGEIVRALGEPDVKGSADLLSHVMRPHLKAKEVNGKLVTVVVDAQGNERIKDSQGNPFGVKDLALELRGNPKYGRAFDPENKGGSGADPGGGGGGGGAARTIAANDPIAFGQNLEAIAKGEVTVAGLQ